MDMYGNARTKIRTEVSTKVWTIVWTDHEKGLDISMISRLKNASTDAAAIAQKPLSIS